MINTLSSIVYYYIMQHRILWEFVDDNKLCD